MEWDHFNPLQDSHEEIFEQFTKDTGSNVSYTAVQTSNLGQRWYQPLDLEPDVVKRLPDDARIERITKFDGKIYSFPIFNFPTVRDGHVVQRRTGRTGWRSPG